MKGLLSAAAGLVVLSGSASAATSVFAHAWHIGNNLQSCLAKAKRIATKNGFVVSQETVMDNNRKNATFFAFHPDRPYSLAIRCLPTLGIISVGVGGIGSDETFKVYQKVVSDLD